MLKLKDKNKKLIAGLINYKDLCIESALSTGDKKLSFSLHKKDKFYNFIEEEGYIETKTQEYVIKARDVGIDYTRFECVLNLETLEANIFDRFESVEQTITASLNLAIVGTGWTVKANTLKKKRTVRCTNKNALEIVQEIKKTYRVDIVFNTLSKQIEIHEHLGEDKGTYFIDSLNLTALQVQSDSYKFATRIIAEGKDNLTFADINDGKNYVENYQYSNKVKTIYWKDERYTIKESLLEDARAKLEEISKPFTSYNASVLNLAELNLKYKSILDYSLGDTITLLSKSNKVKDKQRIVKTIEYPQDHSRDTVELANATLKFEDIQQENQETTDTVNNITTDNGTVNGSTIDSITTKQIEDFKANVVEVVNLKAINANIDNLHANKADIQDLHAVTAKIGTLEATKANITQLNAVNAEISKLNAIKANVTDLNAANGKIDVLESKTASIDNLLAGNLTANNFKANSIVASSGIIADGAIGDAQISSLNANKMRAGTLDTSLVTVAGPNGRLKILGNRLQIFDDVNNRLFERIMLGINDKNRACLTLRAIDGQTVLLTEEGLTKAGITDGFGKADDNSLSALKLDKNSIVRQVNGATETIAGTRIQVGDRTLDIELSTQKNTITEHSKELSSQKVTIKALDSAIKLKVDSQTYKDSINTINNNISITNSNLSKATTELNLLKEKIESKVNKTDIDKTVEEIEDKIKVTINKISTVESKFTQENNSIKASIQDLNSTTKTITANVSNINKEISTVNTKVLNVESSINILKEKIESKVSQSDIDKSITTVDNKIKLIDSKISDVSSTVIQLRDSVTTQINSINSKTQSIETNLNGKASKQEVTEVNNRVATIKASLDGITQRVSATESKTQTLEHNINDKASKQEIVTLNSKVVDITANLNGITQKVSATETFTKSLNDKLWETTNKLNNVEQRITPISIINTVSSAYYKKGEVDNVFSTKSQVEQLDNRMNYRFSNTGYSNLIFNGNFANGTVHWKNWGNCSLVAENGQLLVRAKQSSNKASMGAVSSTFVLEKDKKYSLSFQATSCWNIPWLNYIYLLGEDGVNYRLDLNFDVNSADLVYRTATFTAPATKWVRLLIGIEGYLQTDVSGFKLVDVCLVEGDIPRRFIPNANEISEGATSIDSNGVVVRFTDDSYVSMTRGGFAWKTKNMEKAYHCLAETGWVNISTGAWLGDHYDIKITLPEYFRGKVFTPCSMIQGWYVESNFSLNQLVVNIPYETINYSEGSFVIRVKALTRDGTFQRNINISWLAIA